MADHNPQLNVGLESGQLEFQYEPSPRVAILAREGIVEQIDRLDDFPAIDGGKITLFTPVYRRIDR